MSKPVRFSRPYPYQIISWDLRTVFSWEALWMKNAAKMLSNFLLLTEFLYLMECAGYLFPSTSLRLFEYLIVFSLVNFDILVSRFADREAGGRKVKEPSGKTLCLCIFPPFVWRRSVKHQYKNYNFSVGLRARAPLYLWQVQSAMAGVKIKRNEVLNTLVNRKCIYQTSYIWTEERDMKTSMIIAVVYRLKQ